MKRKREDAASAEDIAALIKQLPQWRVDDEYDEARGGRLSDQTGTATFLPVDCKNIAKFDLRSFLTRGRFINLDEPHLFKLRKDGFLTYRRSYSEEEKAVLQKRRVDNVLEKVDSYKSIVEEWITLQCNMTTIVGCVLSRCAEQRDDRNFLPYYEQLYPDRCGEIAPIKPNPELLYVHQLITKEKNSTLPIPRFQVAVVRFYKTKVQLTWHDVPNHEQFDCTSKAVPDNEYSYDPDYAQMMIDQFKRACNILVRLVKESRRLLSVVLCEGY